MSNFKYIYQIFIKFSFNFHLSFTLLCHFSKNSRDNFPRPLQIHFKHLLKRGIIQVLLHTSTSLYPLRQFFAQLLRHFNSSSNSLHSWWFPRKGFSPHKKLTASFYCRFIFIYLPCFLLVSWDERWIQSRKCYNTDITWLHRINHNASLISLVALASIPAHFIFYGAFASQQMFRFSLQKYFCRFNGPENREKLLQLLYWNSQIFSPRKQASR